VPGNEDLGRAIEQGRRFLRTDVDSEGSVVYRLFHQALADHLTGEAAGGVRPVASGLLDALLGTLPTDGLGNRVWSEADSYLREQAATHAVDAGRLDELLSDPEYLVYGSPVATGAVLALAAADDAVGNAAVYRRSQTMLTDAGLAERRQLLMVEALRHARADLAHRLAGGADVPSSAWLPRWVSGTATAGALRHVVRAGTTAVTTLACGEINGQEIVVTGDRQGLVRIWDLGAGRLLQEFDVSPPGRNGGTEVLSADLVHWTGWPTMLLTACGLTIALRDFHTGRKVAEIPSANQVRATAWEYNAYRCCWSATVTVVSTSSVRTARRRWRSMHTALAVSETRSPVSRSPSSTATCQWC
jgi:hypothetical protein